MGFVDTPVSLKSDVRERFGFPILRNKEKSDRQNKICRPCRTTTKTHLYGTVFAHIATIKIQHFFHISVFSLNIAINSAILFYNSSLIK